MKNYKKFILPLLVVAVLTFGFFAFQSKNNSFNTPDRQATQVYQANLTVDDGADSRSFDISGFIGKTALEATVASAKVVTSGDGVNAFVSSINGRVANATIHEFWELVINGTSAQVGAGSYIIQNGDSILWKISTY